MLLNTCGPLIEPFRGDTSSVMPEIFYQASMFLNNLDPGLKIAGVTRRWESMFLNNLDPGLKIAGVTRRWASTSFQYCGPRLKDCRGDGTRCHCEFVVSLTWQSQVFYSI